MPSLEILFHLEMYDFVNNNRINSLLGMCTGSLPRLVQVAFSFSTGSAYVLVASFILKLYVEVQTYTEVWHQLLEDCVVCTEENIRLTALQALPPLWANYFRPTSQDGLVWRDRLVERYTKALSTEKEIQSQGFSAALGEYYRCGAVWCSRPPL